MSQGHSPCMEKNALSNRLILLILALMIATGFGCQSEQELQAQREQAQQNQLAADNRAALDGKLKEILGAREFFDLSKSGSDELFFRAWNSSEENPDIANAMCPVGDEFAFQKLKPEFKRIRSTKHVLFTYSYDAEQLQYDFLSQKFQFKYLSFSMYGPEGGVIYPGCKPSQQALHITQPQAISVQPTDAEAIKQSLTLECPPSAGTMCIVYKVGAVKAGSLAIYTLGEVQEPKVVENNGRTFRYPLIKPVAAFAAWSRAGQPTRFFPVN